MRRSPSLDRKEEEAVIKVACREEVGMEVSRKKVAPYATMPRVMARKMIWLKKMPTSSNCSSEEVAPSEEVAMP